MLSLMVLKYTGSLLAAFYGVYATLTDFRKDKDGRRILTSKGYIGISVLMLSSLLALTASGLKDHIDSKQAIKDRDEKIEAARLEATRREQAMEREIEVRTKVDEQLKRSEKISVDLTDALRTASAQLALSKRTSAKLEDASQIINRQWNASTSLDSIRVVCYFNSPVDYRRFTEQGSLDLEITLTRPVGGDLKITAHSRRPTPANEQELDADIAWGKHWKTLRMTVPPGTLLNAETADEIGRSPNPLDTDWDVPGLMIEEFRGFVSVGVSEVGDSTFYSGYRLSGTPLRATLQINISASKLSQRLASRITDDIESGYLPFHIVNDLRDFKIDLRLRGSLSKYVDRAALYLNDQFRIDLPVAVDKNGVTGGGVKDILANVKLQKYCPTYSTSCG